LDDNNDRGIDEREFSKAVREYGFDITDEEISLLMQVYDRDGNGTISYDEFLRGVRVSIRSSLFMSFPHGECNCDIRAI
jgi:Ca2+-binding EF-hand superfamily protein